jgi:hypothetical protein
MKSRSGLIRGCAVPLRAGIRAGIFRYLPVFLAVGLLCGRPASGEPSGNRVVRGVVADGACAIYGMSAEQSQLIALQKARSAAIERAAGVRVASSTLVRDGMVAVDLIRTYSRGYVIAEKVEWLPIAQYRDSPDRPPIPEYRVRIRADVAIPGRNAPSLGLEAKLNNKVFRKGEKAVVEVSAQRETRLALFNITADDKVVMLFPHPFEKGNVLAAGKTLRFPPEGSRIALEMHTLPGHQRDAEAFFVVATASETEVDFASTFESGKSYPLSSFFERYAEIAPHADEIILPYAIDGGE